MFFVYEVLVLIFIIFSPIIFLIRIMMGKENPKRFLEKFCIYSKKLNFNETIWLHGSSVGEILSIIPIIYELEKNKKIKKILLSSSTTSSGLIFSKYKFKKTTHIYFPIDTNYLTNKFINYWKPKIAIFIDSEIWPNMLMNLKERSIKRILLNARISKKSFKKWKRLGRFSKLIFQIFNYTYPQNLESKYHLRRFGVNKIKTLGNLKFSQSNYSVYKSNKNFDDFLKTKKIWCAASTHPGEEEICISVYQRLLKRYSNLILVLIPRHVERVGDIKKIMIKYNLKYHIHSQKNLINKDTKIYIVDTYGETGFFLKNVKLYFWENL